MTGFLFNDTILISAAFPQLCLLPLESIPPNVRDSCGHTALCVNFQVCDLYELCDYYREPPAGNVPLSVRPCAVPTGQALSHLSISQTGQKQALQYLQRLRGQA